MSTTNSVGSEMFSLIKELYPLCRSITGDGTRKTLQMINRIIPLNITEVPTGTKVFDWFVPKEWNIKEAYLKDMNGRKLVDFRDSNLHVLNYSIPVNKKISIDELKKHLFSMPDRPDWIPYRTSYYKEDWGFCLSNRKYESLEENEYEVFINSTLEDGHLTYGEFFIRGELEFFFPHIYVIPRCVMITFQGLL
jgi:aminopeptidase-like protein